MTYTLNPIWTLNTHIPHGTSCRLLEYNNHYCHCCCYRLVLHMIKRERDTNTPPKKNTQNNWKETKYPFWNEMVNGHCMEVCHIWICSIQMYRHGRPWMWLIGYVAHAHTYTHHIRDQTIKTIQNIKFRNVSFTIFVTN